MTHPKHSPLPWHDGDIDGDMIFEKGGGYVASVLREMDARFILRAVNCHEDLLAGLKDLVEEAREDFDNHGLVESFENARAAIAKAEGRIRGKGENTGNVQYGPDCPICGGGQRRV